jgi:hypothetical protein
MEQDNDLAVEVPDVPELPQVQDGQEDKTDWKAIAQERQDALAKMQGMTKRFQTKLKKLAEAPKSSNSSQGNAPEKKGFDYAEKAYLKSSGINSEEFNFVKEVMDSTGKDIDSVLSSNWFQKDLQERRQLKTTEAATPSGTKRAGQQTRNDVDYWIAKGELPKDDPALARKVVNAKIRAERDKNQFAPNSVIIG